MSLVLLASGYAQSQQPSPSGGEKQKPGAEKPKNAQQQAGIMNRGTEGAPLVIKIVEPPVIKLGPENYKKEGEGHPFQGVSGAEWATAAIAFFALGVAYWQLRYFREQLRIMNQTLSDTKDAAKITERAAKATEDSVKAMQTSDETQLRAYVSIKLDWQDVRAFDRRFTFHFTILNHGRSPAKEVGFRAVAVCVENPPKESPAFDIMHSDRWNEKRMTLFPAGSSGTTGRMNCTMDWGLSPEQIRSVQGGSHAVLVGVEIKYLDIFQPEPRKTREFFLYYRDGVSTVPGGSVCT